ncbi:MAG: tetratricopeptide repeat protein [Thermoanaerobaculia bacterium]
MGARALAAALLLLILGGSRPLSGIELPAGELWSRANAAADAGDFDDADRQLSELLERGAQIDLTRYPLLARSAAGLAEQAYREGNEPLSEWSMAAAARLDPVTAAVPFAAADLARSRGDWIGAIRSVISGLVKLMADDSTGTLARMDLLLILALAIFLTAAGFAIALLVRYGRAATHDFREMLGGRLSAGVTSVLAFSLLFLPVFLWLGPVWLILWWLALTYAYGNLRERAAIVTVLVAVALSPLVVDYAATRMAGLQNPIVRAAVADLNDAHDEGAVVGMQSLLEAQPEDPLLHLLLGNLYFQQGSDVEALVHFRRAVQLDEDLAGAHLNIGNLHFLNNDFTAAISRYERAGTLDPRMAIAPFNHSVAAAQMNRYDEQGRQLELAKQRSRSVVNQLTRRPPVQKVASYELPAADGWAAAERIARTEAAPEVFGTYAYFDPSRSARNALTGGAAAALILALLIAWARRRTGLAGSCIKCGRTFCPRCKSARESATYCTQCIHIYLKRDGVSLDTKRKKLDEVQDFQSRTLRTRRLLAFLLPGSARVYEGAVISGLVLMLVFLLFVSSAILVGRTAPLGPSADMLRLVLRLGSVIGAVLVWLLFSIPSLRERSG